MAGVFRCDQAPSSYDQGDSFASTWWAIQDIGYGSAHSRENVGDCSALLRVESGVEPSEGRGGGREWVVGGRTGAGGREE